MLMVFWSSSFLSNNIVKIEVVDFSFSFLLLVEMSLKFVCVTTKFNW